jgi:hypothetical protein
MWFRPFAYLWAFPNTLIGLLLVPFSLRRGGVHLVDGVIEIHGPLVNWLLTRCTPLEDGASAMTIGHVVLGRDQELLNATRNHERVHVRQYERWGPLFIPAYFGASLFLWLTGGRAYQDNPFEREAFGR